ncbi:unnamed protein product [Spirodela intermedia]|uniref:Uncharacterized protein n=1 Tax=Spirodela intermedia TaxID=51605 RepID=A0A7I8I8X9_SPIIN|nr:unnamed protein product [Spirodela intermedia]CAA6653944.1 unnamed protein product [Spirodela intermedia]
MSTVGAEKGRPSSSSSVAVASSSSPQLDPLLKDLSEKKQSFRRSVVSLAAELKDVRNRLATQEESVARETLNRQLAERKAKNMEEEISLLQRSLQEKDGELQASASSAELHQKELEKLRNELSLTQAAAEASAVSSESAEIQCLVLLRELDEKNLSLKEHEDRVNRLGEQLALLQKDLQAREISQNELKGEVKRIEKEMMQAVADAGANKEFELQRFLEGVSPKNFENLNKHMSEKDEEICRLRDEIRFISAHWKHKTKELENQLEKHRRADQELKKRVIKLEFCLQETRSQTRKLQRGKDLKDLRDQLALKERNEGGHEKPNFWESSGFKMVVSMSMLVLVVFAKR